MEADEQIDVGKAYKSSLDSVDLINRMYNEGLIIEEEDFDIVERNKKHLMIMLGKDFWTEEQDLEPFQEAVDRTE
jgi:hypothetical protein